MIAIPRHDKWKGVRVRSEFQRLSHEVQLGRTAQYLRKVGFRKGGINTRILNGERLFGFTLADAQLERFFDRQQVVWWDG